MEIIKDLEELETNTDLIEAYDHESSYAEARYIRGCEEGREEGREEGEQIGIEKGIAIFKMFQKGTKPEEISDTMKIPVAKIKQYLDIA